MGGLDFSCGMLWGLWWEMCGTQNLGRAVGAQSSRNEQRIRAEPDRAVMSWCIYPPRWPSVACEANPVIWNGGGSIVLYHHPSTPQRYSRNHKTCVRACVHVRVRVLFFLLCLIGMIKHF